jgi:hypothetical protein
MAGAIALHSARQSAQAGCSVGLGADLAPRPVGSFPERYCGMTGGGAIAQHGCCIAPGQVGPRGFFFLTDTTGCRDERANGSRTQKSCSKGAGGEPASSQAGSERGSSLALTLVSVPSAICLCVPKQGDSP